MKKLFLLFSLVLLISVPLNAQVSFTPSTTTGCAPITISFTNTSIDGVHFDWYFGDGDYVYDSYSPSHAYTNAGTYTVNMYAYDALWNWVGSSSIVLELGGQPDYFSAAPSPACPGDYINFYIPQQPTYSYNWDFGDGSPIQTTNDYYTTHIYSSLGTYYPSVSYYDYNCGTSYSLSGTVVVDNSNPWFGGYPNLFASETTICPGSSINYQVGGGPYQSIEWNFGDGTYGYDSYADVAYNTLGTYNVSVTLVNGCGVDTTLYTTITVDNSVPAPSVSISGPIEVCPGEQFFLTSYGGTGMMYTWDFGDGTPVLTTDYSYVYHVFDNPGTYNVALTATNSCGNSSNSFYTITATPYAPVFDAYLQIYPENVCPGDEFNYSVPWQYDYYINFGDGAWETEGGAHSYDSPGSYPIYCMVQNACGMTAIFLDTVNVMNNLPITQSVYAGASPNAVCPGEDINFYTADGFSSYSWNFGDGYTAQTNFSNVEHPYVNPGSYNVSVTVTNGCGFDTTQYVTIDVLNNLPVDQIDYMIFGDQVCPGSEVYMSFDDDYGYEVEWDFGDGSATSDDLTTSHVYPTVGAYTVALTVTNGCGMDSTVYQTITVANGLTPDLSQIEAGIQTPGCVGDTLYFATNPAGIADYYWDFGDGNSGPADELLIVESGAFMAAFHAYTNPGTYTATLTMTNSCGNSVDTTITVEVGGFGSGTPVDLYFWSDESTPTCEGQPIGFFAVGAGTYIWDFGDGTGELVTYSSFENVEHTYEHDGVYAVTLVGMNSCGNSDEATEMIIIPNSDLDVVTNTVADSDCGENNGTAIVTASGGLAPYTFSWTNGDEGYVADSLFSGIYVVTVTDNNGCSTEALATVSDDQGPVIILENIVHNECAGQDNGVISVSIFGGAPPYDILWSNGETSEDIYNLVAGPYELFITDANGCFSVESFEVQEPATTYLSVITTDADCGMNNGTATAVINNGTGPFNFIWPNSTGSTNSTVGLPGGVYDLMVIDGNTCLIEASFVVNEMDATVILTDSITDPTCTGTLSAVYINTMGGVAPFSYLWSNGSVSQDLTNVVPGVYSVEVTGNNGCSAYEIFNIEMSAPDETDICIVTVDTNYNSNIVVWNPVASPDVVSYNIYKESSQNGLYYLIANQSADSISQYNDLASDAAIRSWRYKVSAVDDCGIESDLSDPHKTIHLSSNLGVGGVVNLIWDHYNGFTYDTYYIWRYHPSTGWEKIDSLGSDNISYTDLTPPSDSNLVYVIEILPPSICTASKVQDHNSSRSNKSSINMPEDEEELGVTENEYSNLSIYPNPTSGLVQLKYSDVIQEVRVYDMSGQLVFRANNNSEILSIDFAAYARGVYSIELYTPGGILHSRIVKQ